MSQKENLQKQIQDIEEVLAVGSIPKSMSDDLRRQLEEKQDQLQELEQQEQAQSQMPTAPVPTAPVQEATPQTGDLDVDKTLATILTLMQSSPEGSGMDSKMVTDLINSALATSVIKLEQLDQKVLEEIRKNQIVELLIPGFGEPIIVTKDDQDIPYFYEILDDMNAGNNIYLIGEAGSGKTYGAEEIAKKLKRLVTIINCSQYTSPTEIIGGQTIDGYKKGKLIDAWGTGKVLILDEMPRLDPNTAGLFNDALAKSSKTRQPQNALIYSSNPTDPPVERSPNFSLIATGNVYPNTTPPKQYKANNQQDLSLLDRFSGSVYTIEYTQKLDAKQCRFQIIYDMLIGNYYEYTKAIKEGRTKPTPTGLRTILKDLNLDDLAVVSYRTVVSFRVAFEFELVRTLEKKRNPEAVDPEIGKTLYKAFESYLVAFNRASRGTIVQNTGFTETYVKSRVKDTINKIVQGKLVETLVDDLKQYSSDILGTYEDLLVPIVKTP
jgi:hypothetical protein